MVDPEQAKIVKLIYREYLDGLSMDKIAAGLEHDGILTGAGKQRWHTSTVRKILGNEKYIGDALLQKTYTVDYLSKKRVKNNGIVPQYYVENCHEAIIPRDIYKLVQEELARRRSVRATSSGKRYCYSSKQYFSQMLYCGECGELFQRVYWYTKGIRSTVWRCENRLHSTGIACHSRTIKEELLKSITLEAVNRIIADKTGYLEILQNNITTVVMESDAVPAEKIDERLRVLQDKLLERIDSSDEYDDIANEIRKLRSLKEQTATDNVVRDEKLNRITNLCDFIKQQSTEVTDFDEHLVRRIIEKITVFDNHFAVEFKSGVSVEIEK